MCDETNKYQQYFEDRVVIRGFEDFENIAKETDDYDDGSAEEKMIKLKQIYAMARLSKYEKELFESVILLGYKETADIYNKSYGVLFRKIKKIRQKLLKTAEKKGITK